MGKVAFLRLALLMSLAVPLLAQEPPPGNRFYLATCGKGRGCGISLMEAGKGSGLRSLQFLPLDFASYMALSPEGDVLYVAREHRQQGGVTSFRIGEGGELSPLSTWETPGIDYCHLVAAPGGKYVYGASYGSGKLVQFTVEAGVLTGAQVVLAHETGEQGEAPHLHFAGVSPDGHFLCTVDLGLGVLESIPLDAQGNLRVEKRLRTQVLPPGSGPRHLVFSHRFPVAYLLNETANTVMTWDYAKGHWNLRQTIPVAPLTPAETDSYTAAIRLSPGESHLLVSNRGRDSLATLTIGEEGMLLPESLAHRPVAKWPRDFAFLPQGDAVVVACERAGLLQLFPWNPREGLQAVPVTSLGELVRPLAILPVPSRCDGGIMDTPFPMP
ncbi:MAG: lactonase family protein [Oligosphaeraceae bacterium]